MLQSRKMTLYRVVGLKAEVITVFNDRPFYCVTLIFSVALVIGGSATLMFVFHTSYYCPSYSKVQSSDTDVDAYFP